MSTGNLNDELNTDHVIELADQTFYRPSLTSILDALQQKLDDLSDPTTFDSLPSLKRNLASIGLGPLTETLREEGTGPGEAPVEIKVDVRRAQDEKVLKLARIKIASEVIGQYLEVDTKDALVRSFE
jgi:hypothetical protein